MLGKAAISAREDQMSSRRIQTIAFLVLMALIFFVASQGGR
jgi:hypothetical protein